MTRRRSLLLFAAILSLSLTGMAQNGVRALAPALPDKLTDSDFWSLVADLSEPGGEFRSDNLLSNELYLQTVIPQLVRVSKLNRVYLGVGPEQNFTYIAALRPKMVFIVDVRRGNLQLHLMYKALFELSSDRADFIFRLFARKRPEGLGAKSTADEIFTALFNAYKATPEKEADDLLKQNLKGLQDHLTRTRHLPLSADDLKGIEYVYTQFCLVRSRTLVLVDERRPSPRRCANLLGPDGGRGRQGAEPQFPGERGELPRAEGTAPEEPAGAGGRQFLRSEGAAGGRDAT